MNKESLNGIAMLKELIDPASRDYVGILPSIKIKAAIAAMGDAGNYSAQTVEGKVPEATSPASDDQCEVTLVASTTSFARRFDDVVEAACKQGIEALAGMKSAFEGTITKPSEIPVVDEDELGKLAEDLINACDHHLKSGRTPLRTIFCRILRPFVRTTEPVIDPFIIRQRIVGVLVSYGFGDQIEADINARADGIMIMLGEHVFPHLRTTAPVSGDLESAAAAIAKAWGSSGLIKPSDPFYEHFRIMAKACAETWGIKCS